LRDFFVKEFETDNIKHRRQEVLQRLRLLLDNDVMKEMLLAPSTTFHIGEAMDDGKVIIIDNSKGKLGEQAAEFFGRFFIAQVLAAAQQRSFRPAHTKRPVYFYKDPWVSRSSARNDKIVASGAKPRPLNSMILFCGATSDRPCADFLKGDISRLLRTNSPLRGFSPPHLHRDASAQIIETR
jgi:hypothetical protein